MICKLIREKWAFRPPVPIPDPIPARESRIWARVIERRRKETAKQQAGGEGTYPGEGPPTLIRLLLAESPHPTSHSVDSKTGLLDPLPHETIPPGKIAVYLNRTPPTYLDTETLQEMQSQHRPGICFVSRPRDDEDVEMRCFEPTPEPATYVTLLKFNEDERKRLKQSFERFHTYLEGQGRVDPIGEAERAVIDYIWEKSQIATMYQPGPGFEALHIPLLHTLLETPKFKGCLFTLGKVSQPPKPPPKPGALAIREPMALALLPPGTPLTEMEEIEEWEPPEPLISPEEELIQRQIEEKRKRLWDEERENRRLAAQSEARVAGERISQAKKDEKIAWLRQRRNRLLHQILNLPPSASLFPPPTKAQYPLLSVIEAEVKKLSAVLMRRRAEAAAKIKAAPAKSAIAAAVEEG